ncbi:MAG: lysophospholipase [Spirochaetales bacterium]|nr:lysophospholipase [Spirochaetales bacterium]
MEDFTFIGQGNTSLRGHYWGISSPKAALLIIHGFGEHGARYAPMAEYLNKRDIAVFAFDHRGHGLSEGKRGSIRSWEQYRLDIESASGELAQRCPNAPQFLLGHSLGGTMALDYIQKTQNKPRGAVVSAPALGKPGLSPVLLAIGRLLSAVAPSFSMKTRLDSNGISRVPEECEKYRQDPLVHDVACARLGTELTAVQNSIFAQAYALDVPLLLTYGSGDAIAPHEPIERFFEEAGGEDKVLQVFPEAFHEIHNDTIREDVFSLYANWMLARI